MPNASTADYASTAPWSGIIGKPDLSSSGAKDISDLKAKGYSKNDIPVFNGSRFFPVRPSSLIDTSSLYGPDNKPYNEIQLFWNPGTLTPFYRTSQSFSLTGVAKGQPVLVGAPYDLQGCIPFASADADGSVTVTLFNTTPYDVTLADGQWSFIMLK
jgi:hypothetical protein